jgi:uncharacterized protein with PQ loop repeat
MDFWLIEFFNSFDDRNKDTLLTFFLSTSISLVTYAIPAVFGKSDVTEKRFFLATLVNDAFPRAIVGGVGFYVALVFLVRSSATDSLIRGMLILIAITVLAWILSLIFTAKNQKTIDKKELEYLKKKKLKLPVEYSILRMLKWNSLVIVVWLAIIIGFCLSRPVSVALNKNIFHGPTNTSNSEVKNSH